MCVALLNFKLHFAMDRLGFCHFHYSGTVHFMIKVRNLVKLCSNFVSGHEHAWLLER
jgi:hypothetical protein